jgi:hypothetical protein
LFVRDRTLMAQPFDAAKLQTTGDALPIAEQVDAGGAIQYQFSASQNGTFEAGVQKPLFPVAAFGASRRNYAVANGGQRFLVAASAGGEKTVPLTVVLNWHGSIVPQSR